MGIDILQSLKTRQYPHKVDDVLRRGLDILVSITLLIIGFPLLAIIGLLIKRDSPGPVLFRGKRIGLHGKTFEILKFRTMYERPESYSGPRVTANGDQRITRIGKWLRDTKLNELPQLWNVLTGDMSLVGPRPEDPQLISAWPEAVKEELLSVRPGITSPASVIYRWEEEMLSSETLVDDYLKKILPDKLRIDQMYIHRRSLLADLDVILVTVSLLLPYFNRGEVKPASLYFGPLASFTSRFLSWFLIDFTISGLATLLAGLIFRIEMPLDLGIPRFLAIVVIMGAGFSLSNYVLGMQKISWKHASYNEILPLSISVVFTIAFLQMLNFTVNRPGNRMGEMVPLGVIILAGIFAWFGFIIARYRMRVFSGAGRRIAGLRGTPKILRERVLLVGAGDNSSFAIWLLTHYMSDRFIIQGMVDDDPRKQGMVFNRAEVLGSTYDIQQLVEKHDIGMILYTIKRINDREKKRILDICQSTGVKVVMIPEIMDEVTGKFIMVKDAKPS